ncbi:hypothetical protein [Leisingera sp.]|uniref:hypothetical protein n=1 Tax=Leisingera sp. TaxID=1879318 RepID=UPI002B2788E3|nr:hypothetical protein [Leisingera sp.]
MALAERSECHVQRLRNGAPNLHLVHLPGLGFTPIRSNLRRFPPLVADFHAAVEQQVAEIAMVAGNPRGLTVHCHVTEHQTTGHAGCIRVT